MHSGKRGFLMWTVVGTLLVLGILATALHFMARQQNAQAHRVTFGEIAHNLAEAGIDHIGRRVRDHLFARPLPRSGLDAADGDIFRVMLLDAERLKRAFRAPSGSNDRWLTQLLGKDYRYPLDVLVSQLPGSSLEVTLDVDPQPLVKDPIVTDAVEKRVRFILRSKAAHRGVTRIMETGYEVKVVHPFPPVTSKFNLFVANAESGQAYNTCRNSPAGLPYTAADFQPLVFANTPPQEVPDMTLIRENLPHEPTDPYTQMPQIRDALSRRGYIFLGTGSSAREIFLDMAAGPVLPDGQGFGEFFHMFDPLPFEIGGFDAVPGFFKVESPPPFFNNPVPDPTQPGLFQKANINFLYWGFHYPDAASNLRDGSLGSSLLTENSSVLHLFGTHREPSRTKVFGNVLQAYTRFGYLALDRDASTGDEQVQAANLQAAGLQPAVRERDTIDPTLKFADREQFETDLRREAAGQPPAQLATMPASVVNKNFVIQGVVADPGHPTVPLDPAGYRYARMFDGTYDTGETDPSKNRGYSRFMSKVDAIPYNEILDYMYYGRTIPPEANPSFKEPTLNEGVDFYRLAEQVPLAFRDPLHDQLQKTAYSEIGLPDVFKPVTGEYSQAVGTTPGARSGLGPPSVAAQSPAATFLMARSYREYRSAGEFMADCYVADLNLLSVNQCVRIREGDLALPSAVRYIGNGCILVMEGSVSGAGQVPINDPSSSMESTLTIVAMQGDIVFSAGLQQAAFVALRGSIVPPSGAPLLVEGSLATSGLAPASLTGGGRIAYRGLYDPTTDIREPRGTAYIDYYQVAMSDLPMDWKRVAP